MHSAIALKSAARSSFACVRSTMSNNACASTVRVQPREAIGLGSDSEIVKVRHKLEHSEGAQLKITAQI